MKIRTDRDLIKIKGQGKFAQMGGIEEFGGWYHAYDMEMRDMFSRIQHYYDELAKDETCIRKIVYENLFQDDQTGEFHYVARIKKEAVFGEFQEILDQE